VNDMGTRLISDHAADQAERAIAGWILSGRYREGDRLPGIPELTAELGVSHPTLSKAIGRLKARRLVQIEPGEGVIVNSLNEFVGLDMICPMIDHCDETWRRLTLTCQFYDFIRPMLAEWAEQSAYRFTTEQLEWFNHYTLALEDRFRLKSTRQMVGQAEYELARVLAAGSGNFCSTFMINPLQDLFMSEALVAGQESILPSEAYRGVYNALRSHDGKLANRLIDEAFWKRELVCIAELGKLGWTASGDPLTDSDAEPEAA